MLRATAICDAGGKLWWNYTDNENISNYANVVSSVMGIPITELIQRVQGGEISSQETWVHELIARHAATTAICDAGGKLWADYSDNKVSSNYANVVSSVTGIPVTELIQGVQGGVPSSQGTWVHELIATHVATTAICDAGGKLWWNYTDSQNSSNYANVVSSVIGIPITELIQRVQGGVPSLQGTCVHEFPRPPARGGIEYYMFNI
jgi:hypothetical protein